MKTASPRFEVHNILPQQWRGHPGQIVDTVLIVQPGDEEIAAPAVKVNRFRLEPGLTIGDVLVARFGERCRG